MDEKQIEELAKQIADDFESGRVVQTEGTPTPELTTADVEAIRRELDPWRVDYRLYMGVDWGRDRDQTGYYFPTT